VGLALFGTLSGLLLVVASDQSQDYYPQVYSFDLATSARRDLSWDAHSEN
jgi:hypothetical protein